MTQIRYLYEECEFEPFPGWVVAEEDRRIHHARQFGTSGDSWATIVTAQLEEESVGSRLFSSMAPRLARTGLEPLSTWLQLRVCSPTFMDNDPRFFVAGQHLAFVQDEFDFEALRNYFESRLREAPRGNLAERYRYWAKYFHLYDPDDD